MTPMAKVETRPTNNDKDVQIQFVNATTYKVTKSNDSFPYTLTTVNGKSMLNLGSDSYEINIISDKMTWISESDLNHPIIVKGVTTIQFKKL
jgi:hypothetical protein